MASLANLARRRVPLQATDAFEVPFRSGHLSHCPEMRGLLLLWVHLRRRWPTEVLQTLWQLARPPPLRSATFERARVSAGSSDHLHEILVLKDLELVDRWWMTGEDDGLVIDGGGHVLWCPDGDSHSLEFNDCAVALRNMTLRPTSTRRSSRQSVVIYGEDAEICFDGVVFDVAGPLHWSNWVAGQDLKLRLVNVLVSAMNDAEG